MTLMRDMGEIERDYRDRDVIVLAVNIWEDEERFRQVAEASEHEMLWLRAGDEAIGPYGVNGLPTQVIVDRDGTVRWTSGLRSAILGAGEIRKNLDAVVGE